jgi:hypothetical protein
MTVTLSLSKCDNSSYDQSHASTDIPLRGMKATVEYHKLIMTALEVLLFWVFLVSRADLFLSAIFLNL